MTQKEAIEIALHKLGGRAPLQEIYPLAILYGDFSGSKDKKATIRNYLQTSPKSFRRSPDKPVGWYELLSYQEELAILKHDITKKDLEISSLKEKVELLEKRPTVEDLIRKLVKATKSLFKIHRDHADYVRQVLELLSFTKEAEELAAWIEHKENRLADAVVKIAEKPTIQVDIKAGAHAQISEQGISNQYTPANSISSNEY